MTKRKHSAFLDWRQYLIPLTTALLAAFGAYYAVKERVAVLEERVETLKESIHRLEASNQRIEDRIFSRAPTAPGN